MQLTTNLEKGIVPRASESTAKLTHNCFNANLTHLANSCIKFCTFGNWYEYKSSASYKNQCLYNTQIGKLKSN